MAASLIDSMTSEFDSDAFHDNYREALIELVEAKVAGRELTPARHRWKSRPSPSVSLADALRASLAAQKGSVEGKPEAKAIGGGGSQTDGADGSGAGGGAAGGEEPDGAKPDGAKPAAKRSSRAASGAGKAASGAGKAASGASKAKSSRKAS